MSTCQPSILGIMTSRMMRSGSVSATIFKPSSPSAGQEDVVVVQLEVELDHVGDGWVVLDQQYAVLALPFLVHGMCHLPLYAISCFPSVSIEVSSSCPVTLIHIGTVAFRRSMKGDGKGTMVLAESQQIRSPHRPRLLAMILRLMRSPRRFAPRYDLTGSKDPGRSFRPSVDEIGAAGDGLGVVEGLLGYFALPPSGW